MVMTILVFAVLGICAFYDWRSQEIPLVLVAFGAVLSLTETVIALTDHVIMLPAVFAALLPGALMLVLAFFSKQAIGYGDGLLMCAVGPVFGVRLMIGGVMLAFFLSSIVAIFLLVCKKADRKMKLPFVPFLASAMGVMQFVVM